MRLLSVLYNRCLKYPTLRWLRISALGFGLFAGAEARAHDSPEHSVEELTTHIGREGESVPLLLRRASHYRVLGKIELAIADLTRVLELAPNHLGALTELARIHLAQGDFAEALQRIHQAIESASYDTAKAGVDTGAHLYAVRGDIYNAQGKWREALGDYNRALAGDKTQVEWYLTRSRLHKLLQLRDERVKGLKHGHQSTQSVVLFNEWIEALIDSGHAAQALELIEPPLEQARLKSSWLIRRARAKLALGTPEYSAQARADLQAAIAEINTRLRPARPDLDLLLDRADAHLLGGDAEAALSDLLLARKHGADAERLEPLERRVQDLLGESDRK